MHKRNLFKRIISVTLAIVMVVGVLPFVGGKIWKAVAGTTVQTYEALKEALEPTLAEGTADVSIVLGADIDITDTITIDEPGVYRVTCDSDKYKFYTSSQLSGALFNITNADATVIFKDVTIEDVASQSSVIINGGSFIMDEVSVIDNDVSNDIVTNNGKLYVNNSTFAGNKSAASVMAANSAVISGVADGAEAYVLNTTITGNDKVGVKSAVNVTTKLASSLVVSNFYSGTEKDLELAGANSLVAYTLYGTANNNAGTTMDHAMQETDNDKRIFNAYDKITGKPLVYGGVVYLNGNHKAYTQYGTVTYFSYNDPANVIAAYKTADGAGSDGKPVGLTACTDEDNVNMSIVQQYQTGTDRNFVMYSQAPVGSAQSSTTKFYSLTIKDSENGEVTGTIQKVYPANTLITLTATPDSGYDFIRWVNETDSENRFEAGTNEEFSFNITSDTIISATFAKYVHNVSVTLNLGGEKWLDQDVELYQFGTVQVDNELTFDSVSQKYTGSVYTGVYDIYVNQKDSGVDLSVDESGGSEVVNYATIQYNGNGGNGTAPEKQNVSVGTKITIAGQNSLTKDEYTFTGWTKSHDISGTVYAAGSEYTVTENTTFLANWKSIYADAEVVVRLNGVPMGNFEVKFKSKASGREFLAAYEDGMYTSRLDNDGEYEIFINGIPVGVLDTDDLTRKTFDYYTVTYYGNGNDDGQADIEKTVLSNTPYALIGNTYSKTGYDFVAWNTNQNGTGSRKQAGDEVRITGETGFYAMWDARNYLVTYDVNGGNELPENLCTKYIDFGERYNQLPTPTRTGYNFLYWTLGDKMIVPETLVETASDHTLVARWAPVIYDIHVPKGDSLKFSVVSMNGEYTVEHDTDFRFKIEPIEGYSMENATVTVSNSNEVNPEKIVLHPVDGIYTIPAVDANKTVMVSGVEDTLAPTLEIEVSENKWHTFINDITFGKFFKNTQAVVISAEDYGVGLKKVEYYVGEAMSFEELMQVPAEDWTTIRTGDNFNINPNNALVVYARAYDTSENVSYACSEGLVLDDIAPVVKGVSADGLFDLDPDETYIAPLTVKATDEYLFKVVVNGIEREYDKNGEVKIAGSAIPVEIVVTDMAGNMTSNVANVLSSSAVVDGEITDEVENTSGVETDLATPPSELKDMFITEDDKYAVDCGEDINILVEVRGEDVVPEDDKETSVTEANAKGYTIAEYLDLTLLKEYLTQGTSEKIHETPQALTFVFDIPTGFLSTDKDVVRTFYVGRVHGDDNDFTWLEDKDTDPSTVTISTDKFSTYVLAYKDVENEVTTQTTPTVDPDNSQPDPNNNVTQPDATQPGTQDTTGGDNAGSGTTGGSSSAGGEHLADTGDRTPILFTVGCLIVGCVGFIFFDKKRKNAKAE